MDGIGPDRWKRIEAILDEALELAGAQRATFVSQACAGDAELLERVEALLAADDKPRELILDVPLHLYAGPLLQDTEPAGVVAEMEPVEGRRIGPYRLVREVGRGGMATVYLADRTDGEFEQRVALTLIRRGMDTYPVLRRFLQERQILAGMQHPHIAHLLDGGIAENGQPYFAMEYIEGRPLTRYCDESKLGIAGRLQLFLDVCEAVRYAHQHLVIHRDLKPSNILVAPDGRVKLLDFGIAKLLHPEIAEGDTQTRTGGRFLTLSCAAPEQVRNERITTATDVYALGVILYELLAGHRPYRIEKVGPDEAERLICVEQPRRPATRVVRTEEIRQRDGTTERLTPETVSEARGTLPGKLRRQLAGDLDNIVLKALAKEPELRYPSVEALIEDLQRYLAGLPVRARQATAGYRARKFVRRHRKGVAIAALLVLFLAGGVAGTSWQARLAAIRVAFELDHQRRTSGSASEHIAMGALVRPVSSQCCRRLWNTAVRFLLTSPASSRIVETCFPTSKVPAFDRPPAFHGNAVAVRCPGVASAERRSVLRRGPSKDIRQSPRRSWNPSPAADGLYER